MRRYVMVEIPDRLRCLFAACVTDRGGSYVIEVPRAAIERHAVTPNETYRVVVLPESPEEAGGARQAGQTGDEERTPPVDEGEVREVTIEAVGDQGDGIAKVERGYVVIVPGTDPGDEVRVEFEEVRDNVAFARVLNDAEAESIAQDPLDASDDSVMDLPEETQ